MTQTPSLSTLSLKGKTALVTGGTFGIGRATALGLAQRGMTVVITGRDASRLEEAVRSLRLESNNPNVSSLKADFFVPAQVRALAEEFVAQHERLDVLVNNAGGNFTERKLVGGFERTWALNHLAYMQLTLALLPLLKASAPARVVVVASGWYADKLEWDNLQGERKWGVGEAYFRSKLANLLFTYALAKKLEGTGITVNAVNPGIVDTGISRGLSGLGLLVNTLLKPLKKNVQEGAFPSLYMATSPEVEGVTGQFFDKRKFVSTKPVTHDPALQARLWKVSLEQLGLSDSD